MKILFRIWDKINGRMHYMDEETGLFLSLVSGSLIQQTGHVVAVSDCAELMQYIGIDDINGEKLYRGDIILTPHGHVRVIEHENGTFHARVPGYEKGKPTFPVHFWSLQPPANGPRKIGNIYENPEMLMPGYDHYKNTINCTKCKGTAHREDGTDVYLCRSCLTEINPNEHRRNR